MQKTVVLIILVLILFVSCTKKKDMDIKRYQIKSCYIKYETVTDEKKIEDLLYFDDWGKKEARYTTVYSKTGEEKSSNYQVSTPEYDYNIDKGKKSIVRSKNIMFKTLARHSVKELDKINKELIRLSGGEKIGSELINGKECTIWEFPDLNVKIWMWKGISLKTEAKKDDKLQVMTATIIDDSREISENVFKIPEDYKITDMESLVEKTDGSPVEEKIDNKQEIQKP